MVVLTRKFSEFPDGTLDEAVGLAAGTNTRGPTGSGSGVVTQVISQPGNTLRVGQWVKIDASGEYVTALATTPILAEAVGVVVSIVVPGDTFIVQQSGYIDSSQNVFVGLVPGDPYFLDTIVSGNMVNTDALIDGQVSKPVFIPDTPTSGWVISLMRGLIVGGGFSGGPAPMSDTNIVVVTQNNTFSVGEWVRISTPSAGQVNYVLAQANTLQNAQVAGVVISATPTTFVLQFAGYNVGAVTADQSAAVLVPSTVYYLSSTTAGKITSVDPIVSGGISKPVFYSEQTTATVSVNAGYVLPQRPLSSIGGDSNNVSGVSQPGNTFAVGDALYLSADQTFSLANAYSNLEAAQAEWVVTSITSPGDTFTVQQGGKITGLISTDDQGDPIESGIVYYISPVIGQEGKLTPFEPVDAGLFSKPFYIQQIESTGTGWLLDQRPLETTPSGAPFIVATGGTITTVGNTKIHTFNSSGTFEITSGSGPVEYLIVAGGGGGGSDNDSTTAPGSGGGAGGVLMGTTGTLTVGTFAVTVGAGGNGGAAGGYNQGSNGANSVFNALTAIGGGGGGSGGGIAPSGLAGGSGGGAGYDFSSPGVPGAGTPGQGNTGGSRGVVDGAGGGGGAGGVGGNGSLATGSATNGGAGGPGIASSITGAAVIYAAGGGGGSYLTGAAGPGGSGIGGNGASNTVPPTAGATNTGSGGGGISGTLLGAGGNGGSGVVILSYTYA